MGIEWNKVTWYSKTAALALLILLPFIGFYFGAAYQEKIDKIKIDELKSKNLSGQSLGGGNISVLNSRADSIKDGSEKNKEETISAQRLTAIEINRAITLRSNPNLKVKLLKATKAEGGVETSECNKYYPAVDSKFIFMRYAEQSSPSGACLATDKKEVDGEKPALVILDFEILNNSGASFYGKIFNVFYHRGGGTEILASDRLAAENPPPDGYRVESFSSAFMRIGFEIPESVNSVNLVWGDYGRGAPSGEEYFSKGEDGFVIDFAKNIFYKIQG